MTEQHLAYKFEGHNLLCAIDIKTNGSSPGTNDITELNLLPLDHEFKRSPQFPPFHTRIIPKRRNSLAKIAKTDYDLLDYDRAYELFDSWFSLLNLRSKGSIIPLAYNWAAILPFLNDFFGYDDDGTLFADLYFKKHLYKDARATLSYLKDVAYRKLPGYQELHLIHNQDNLQKVMATLGLIKSPADNYYHNCTDVATLYKHLIEIFPA